jgi:hypothetical protein
MLSLVRAGICVPLNSISHSSNLKAYRIVCSCISSALYAIVCHAFCGCNIRNQIDETLMSSFRETQQYRAACLEQKRQDGIAEFNRLHQLGLTPAAPSSRFPL